MRQIASDLNRHCACITLDRQALNQNVARQLQEAAVDVVSSPAWQQMFAGSAVFVPEQDVQQMQAVVRALEAAISLPDFQRAALSWAPDSAKANPGAIGVFMGYDFHLAETGPRLIEINSNAGGAFLNAKLAHAQCCSGASDNALVEAFDDAVIAMLEQEWRAQGREGAIKRVAIVDDDPDQQYLYPEFLLAQSLLRQRGIDAVICTPCELSYSDNKLSYAGASVDLVYNRLVDFGLDNLANCALRQAWLKGTAVVTPNPRTHALYADKRNLTLLSHGARLLEWGLAQSEVELLQSAVPRVEVVQPENADRLWRERKQLFFKPVAGHGSKGVYRGSKLTKRVFDAIVTGDYVAQEFVPPSERVISVDGERKQVKVDVRLYTYRGRIMLTAARLYQGQATNFRTPGGGFAPLFTLPSAPHSGGRSHSIKPQGRCM